MTIMTGFIWINAFQGLGVADKLKINIEPGLFEWLAWYQDEMPSWMTAQVSDDIQVMTRSLMIMIIRS